MDSLGKLPHNAFCPWDPQTGPYDQQEICPCSAFALGPPDKIFSDDLANFLSVFMHFVVENHAWSESPDSSRTLA